MTEPRHGHIPITADELRRHGVTLLPDEARAALEALTPDQVREDRREIGGRPFPVIQIWYAGSWRDLARRDVRNQAPTFYQGSIAEATAAISYGASVTEDAFYVIDRLTDG